jgi:putative transcriptional regulator
MERKNYIKVELEELMWKRRIKSVNALSKMTGITRQTLHRLLKGEAIQIDFRTLSILCEVLNCDINELLVFKKTS